jgi:hypothetical protein
MSDAPPPPSGEPNPHVDPPLPPAVSPPPQPGNPMPAVPAGSGGFAPQNGLGTAALVMGILQFFCLGPIGAILAIVFGHLGVKKANAGLATNGGVAKTGFWLGIVGVILSVIGIIVTVIVISLGVVAANNALDTANNARTGLADGNYGMNPSESWRINDRCSFGGNAVNVDTNETTASSVRVVGEGSIQCGSDSGTPDAVYFTVTGGVAEIVAVQ